MWEMVYMVDTRNFVKDDLQGKCDCCKKYFDIGRGDNFAWIEKEKKWKCRECESQGVWA